MTLAVTPARTVATNYIVSLTSQEDASDYSLLSPSSGSPSSVGTRVSVMDGVTEERLTLTPVQNDGDRVDDTITLQLFKANAAGVKGVQLGDDIELMVLDRHKLPTVTRGAIMVDGNAVTSLAEGEMGTVELKVDRGTATDAVPDSELIKVMLSLAATSEAGAEDLPAWVVGGERRRHEDDGHVRAGGARRRRGPRRRDAGPPGPRSRASRRTVQAPPSIWPPSPSPTAPRRSSGRRRRTWSRPRSTPRRKPGWATTRCSPPGEMIEVMGSALFDSLEGVTVTYSAESSATAVASAMSGDGTVTVTAMGEGDAMITIKAHGSMPSSVMRNDQTDPREASITFPVEVGLEALSFTLKGPDDMNIVEGGMAHANGTMGAAMLTVTANRAVGMDTEVMIMRDRAMSTAMDSDYMPVPTMVTIESGGMMGSVEITATEDNMVEEMEELVLYAMVGDMMVEGRAKLYIWDAAVPALPLIAQLLLAAFLAIGGYRRYLRR